MAELPEEKLSHGRFSIRKVDLHPMRDEDTLPEQELALLRHATQQATLPPANETQLSVSASAGNKTLLFSGAGDGAKIKAAIALAHETGQQLYRIDTAAVVSKYIGETEKNLSALFRQISDPGAILFFDEADSLFGHRSEVKDSHDRYANLSESFLEARAAFPGTVILNLSSEPAQCDLSQLGHVVHFPLSGKME